MKEKNINQLIADLLWGTASDNDRRRLEQMFAENDELKQKYGQLLESKGLARRYRQYAAIAPQHPTTITQPSTPITQHPTINTQLLRAAAVIICIVTFGALWFTYDSRPKAPELSDEVIAAITLAEQSGKNQAVLTVGGQPVSITGEQAIDKAQAVNTHHSAPAIQDRTVTTHHDSEFWMTLEDGTRVHLNYGTQLTYPIHFSGDTREVELQGEAYFFVAKDKSRPFIVHTPNGDVRQYGTEFNINTRDEIGATRVVLVNGSIGITPRGGAESMMRPNDMAILQPGEAEPTISQVDIMPYIAWNTGTFVFDDCTLEQLMRVLGHWYNKRVEFNDDAIREMRFTGEIDKYESILPTMKAIHKVTGLRIEVRGKEIIISE